MSKNKKEPNSKVERDSISSNTNIQNIKEIFKLISDSIVTKERIPNTTTERETYVCLAINKVLTNKQIYFLKTDDSIQLNYQNKWHVVEKDILIIFLVEVALKLGLDENQILRQRDTTRLFNSFIDLTSRESRLKISNKHIDPPKPKPKPKNPFKVGFLQIGEHLYIEKNNETSRTNEKALKRKYGSSSLAFIECFIDFKFEPEHINYQRRIGDDYYNLYNPLTHSSEEGNCDNIKKMLSHLFRDKHFEMILTYLWVLYKKPNHPLPLIALTSKLKGTGKTTFLELLKAIYGKNAKFIDAEDISRDFNSSFMEKLVILIDEKIEGKRRKSDLQKYKKLITGGTQTLKKKYKEAIDIKFVGKFVMCSNDIETMIALEDENTRFWIIDVHKLETEDFDILTKIEKEIPAFLHFLQHEYKPLEKQSRLWLNINDIQTERGKIMQENSRSEVAKEVIARLDAYFIANPNKSEIHFSCNHFLNIYPENKYSVNNLKGVSTNYLARVLKDEFGKTSEIKSLKNPFSEELLGGDRCRCYTFLREEIIKDDDVESKNNFDNPADPDIPF